LATKINKNKVIAAAQKFVQKGQYDKAIKEYAKIVEEDPRDVRIWLKIGDLYAKKGSKKEAIDTYSKVAEFYSEQGFYLKAVAVYKQILKIDGALVDVNLRLAELYKQLGLLSDAMQQYEQVSNFYNQAGRTKEALAALRQIVDLDPENVASRIKLAELYSKEGLREEAVEEFSKAADFLRAENRIDDFVKVAERLVFHQPDNLAVTKELAGIYLRKRDPRRALQKLQLAFKADPRDEETLVMLAQAFEDLGQVPKTVSVLKELAHIHGENGEELKRQEVYRRILSLAPEDDEARQAVEKGEGEQAAAAAYERAPRRSEPIFTDDVMPDEEPEAPLDQPLERRQSYRETEQPIDANEAYYEEPATGTDYDGYEEPFAAPEPFDPAPLDRRQHFDTPDRRQPDRRQPYEEPFDAPEHLEEVQSGDFVEYGIEEEPAVRSGGADFSEEVAKILTEADVYIKYGLHEKAVDHLRQVFTRDPDNVEVHLKLKDLYMQLGRFPEAARELLFLGRQHLTKDRRGAAVYLNEALELDPDNREARTLLGTLEGSEAGMPPPERTFIEEEIPADLEGSFSDAEPIDLDSEDIVEEIPIDAEPAARQQFGGPTPDTYATDAGQPWEPDPVPEDYSSDYGDEDYASQQDRLLSTDRMQRGGAGVIELHGETTDTLGQGTPSSEVIPLGVEHTPSASQLRVRQEEESSGIEDDLEEAEFFIQQNLYGEARAIFEDLAERFPENQLVQGKLVDLDALEQRDSAGEGAPPTREETGDLASELAADFEDAEQEQQRSAEQDANYSVEDVFEEFKRGVDNQVGDEDSDTHYDLGIAYREMGLMDDAIAEFKIAMRSREKEVLCHMMIGLCYAEKDLLSEAISQFKTGLYVEGITDRETIALYFELGQAYERLEDLREALYYYEKVEKKDPRFRDVGSRTDRIRRATDNGDGRLREHSDSPDPDDDEHKEVHKVV
jgi:pilus assembly protein FimV